MQTISDLLEEHVSSLLALSIQVYWPCYKVITGCSRLVDVTWAIHVSLGNCLWSNTLTRFYKVFAGKYKDIFRRKKDKPGRCCFDNDRGCAVGFPCPMYLTSVNISSVNLPVLTPVE